MLRLVETQDVLPFQNAAALLVHQLLELLSRELVAIALVAFLQRVAEGGHLRLVGGGLQQYVVSGEQSIDAYVLVLGTHHAQAVGEDQSVEVHRVAQDVGDDSFADGGRHAFLFGQRRHIEVSRHDAAQSLVDVMLEGRQFHFVQSIHGVRKLRQSGVRIGLGVAMTGEMLADSQNASVLQTTCVTRCREADKLWVVAECACADDGILGVGVDIEHGSKVHLDAQLAALATHFVAIHVAQRVAHVGIDLAERPVPRVLDGIAQSHGQSPFDVHADHHGGKPLLLRHLLDVIDEFGVGCHGAFAQQDAAKMIVLDLAGDDVEVGRGGIGHVIERNDKLSKALLGGKFLHLLIYPFLHLLLICLQEHVLCLQACRAEDKHTSKSQPSPEGKMA